MKLLTTCLKTSLLSLLLLPSLAASSTVETVVSCQEEGSLNESIQVGVTQSADGFTAFVLQATDSASISLLGTFQVQQISRGTYTAYSDSTGAFYLLTKNQASGLIGDLQIPALSLHLRGLTCKPNATIHLPAN